jgi:hypothetical protein
VTNPLTKNLSFETRKRIYSSKSWFKKKGRRRKENGNRKLGERWKCK